MSLALEAPYAIALLSEYTHTLDALPIDLSRNFADLRELDAVLSSTILTIITKIENLTSMIERGTATKEDKLWLLTEIAEEASRLKLGGEDKIRVACQAADNLKAHSNHLRTLTSHLPGFDTSILDRNTVYPHVSEKSYMPTMTADTGRRRRGAAGQLLNAHSGGAGANGVDPSPVKRKRVRDDDIDAGPTRSPKKPTVAESNTRARQNGRGRKYEFLSLSSPSLLPPPSSSSHLTSHSRTGSNAAPHPPIQSYPPHPIYHKPSAQPPGPQDGVPTTPQAEQAPQQPSLQPQPPPPNALGPPTTTPTAATPPRSHTKHTPHMTPMVPPQQQQPPLPDAVRGLVVVVGVPGVQVEEAQAAEQDPTRTAAAASTTTSPPRQATPLSHTPTIQTALEDKRTVSDTVPPMRGVISPVRSMEDIHLRSGTFLLIRCLKVLVCPSRGAVPIALFPLVWQLRPLRSSRTMVEMEMEMARIVMCIVSVVGLALVR